MDQWKKTHTEKLALRTDFKMTAATTNPTGQYLTFFINLQMYGVHISNVREINRMAEITPVPQAPHYLAGVMNLRGKVIPVVNLRKKFDLVDTPYTKQTCIVVIEGQDGLVGMIVDSVSGVIDLTKEQIEPPPEMGHQDKLKYITGMGKLDKEVVILLDIIKTLSKQIFESQTEQVA